VALLGRPATASPSRHEADDGLQTAVDVHNYDPQIVCLDDLIQAYPRKGKHRRSSDDFKRLLKQYQYAEGDIVDKYFANHLEAGAVYTCRKRFGKRNTYRIRMKYPGEQVAAVQPEFEAALWRARSMEQQTINIVSGQPRRMLLETLFSVVVYIIGVLDSLEGMKDTGQDERAVKQHTRLCIQKALRIARSELARLQQLVNEAARMSALRYYVFGLFIGGLVLLALAWTTGRIHMFAQAGTQDLVRTVAAGGLGAIISVMIRISHGQRLDVETTQGNFMTCLAGSFRPVIGGTLGVALYVLLQASLIPLQIPAQPADASYFFTAIAFLAGFSERWAQDTIVRSVPLPAPARAPVPSGSTLLSVSPTEGSNRAAMARRAAPVPSGTTYTRVWRRLPGRVDRRTADSEGCRTPGEAVRLSPN
jgi:hypothetical protein